MQVCTGVAAGATIVDIGVGVSFAAWIGRAIGISRLTARYLATARHTRFAASRKIANYAAIAAIGERVQGKFTPVIRISVTVSPQPVAGRQACSTRARGSAMGIGADVAAASAIRRVYGRVHLATVSVRRIAVSVT